MPRLSGIIYLLLLGACAQQSQVTSSALDSSAVVSEALLRHLVEVRHLPYGRVVCLGDMTLSLDGVEEPDDAELLERFRGIADAVVPASECRLADPTGPIVHIPSGREAVQYEAAFLRWIGDEAVLHGAWYSASLHGEACRYMARRVAEGWRFEAESCGLI